MRWDPERLTSWQERRAAAMSTVDEEERNARSVRGDVKRLDRELDNLERQRSYLAGRDEEALAQVDAAIAERQTLLDEARQELAQIGEPQGSAVEVLEALQAETQGG